MRYRVRTPITANTPLECRAANNSVTTQVVVHGEGCHCTFTPMAGDEPVISNEQFEKLGFDMRPTRRVIRIIPWTDLDTQEPRYTLCMEWFLVKDGRCIRDQRWQLKPGEFEALEASMQAAKAEQCP